MNEPDGCAVILGCSILIAALVCTIGYFKLTNSWQTDAVARGYAEYVADDSGLVVWQWKETHNAD